MLSFEGFVLFIIVVILFMIGCCYINVVFLKRTHLDPEDYIENGILPKIRRFMPSTANWEDNDDVFI